MKKFLGRFAVITAMFMLIFMNGNLTAKAETITKDISPDTDVSDSMSTGEQVNLYKVKVDERGYQTVEFNPDMTRSKNTVTGTNHLGWNIKIYDGDKSTTFEIKGVKKNFTSDKFMFAEGTELFIEVSSNSTYNYPDNIPYTVKLNTVASKDYEVEDNDTVSKATEIFQNTSVNGNLVTSKDEDYYVYNFKKTGVISAKFEIPDFDAGRIESGWDITVYDKDKKVISEYKSVKNDFKLRELPFKKGSKIYIRVSSNIDYLTLSPERVDYRLTLSSGNSSKWEVEYNDTLNTANKLTGSKTGMLMNADDVDVYYFKAGKAKTYKIKIDTGDNIDKDYKVSIFVKNKKKEVISGRTVADKTFTIKAGKGNKVWIKIQAEYKFSPPVGIKYVINYK